LKNANFVKNETLKNVNNEGLEIVDFEYMNFVNNETLKMLIL